MKAWVLHGINNLQLNDVPMPTIKAGEILVQVKAVGICSSDIQRVYTSGSYYYPIILGHEFSGVTSDGRRVGVFPLIPCHECKSCKLGCYETCSNYSYIGSRQNGAFAEYVAVPQWNLITLPQNVTFEQGALLEPAAVALHAVKKIKQQGIVKAAIIGNGAIGRMIGVWLRDYGVQFVEVLGRNDKASFLNYDVCIEAAGTSDAFYRCLELVRANGEVVLVGNPNVNFNIDQKIYWKILRKQITIGGSWNSSYPSDWQHLLEYTDRLHLDGFISHKYQFNNLNEAFDMMFNKQEKYCKVIMTLI